MLYIKSEEHKRCFYWQFTFHLSLVTARHFWQFVSVDSFYRVKEHNEAISSIM